MAGNPGLALSGTIVANKRRGSLVMKKHSYLPVILSLLITICGLGAVAFGQNSRVMAEAQRIAGDKFAITVQTKKGANVYAVNRPSATILNAIDRGLTDLFAVARKNGYSRRLNYADYSVYIEKADRTKDSTGQYSPDIAIAPFCAAHLSSIAGKIGIV